jgi:hypothetical protein
MTAKVTPVSGRQVVKVLRALERRGDLAEFAATTNADALAEMQRDRDRGKEHVRHLLRLIDSETHRLNLACPDCVAARWWLNS